MTVKTRIITVTAIDLTLAEKADPTIGMAELGDIKGYPDEEEYNDGTA